MQGFHTLEGNRETLAVFLYLGAILYMHRSAIITEDICSSNCSHMVSPFAINY